MRAEMYGRGGLERAIEVAVAGGGEPEALGAQQVEQAGDARAVDTVGLGSGLGLGLGLG